MVKRVNLRTMTEPSSATTIRLMSSIQMAIQTRIGRNSRPFDSANCGGEVVVVVEGQGFRVQQFEYHP